MPISSSASADSVTETWPHALPYQVIFEEQRARLGHGFSSLLQTWATSRAGLGPVAAIDAEQLLQSALQRVSKAYAGLEASRTELREACRRRCDSPAQRKQIIDDAHKAVDEAAIECHTADVPLKHLLHLCGSSALCLSGGGIRSASFSLGVLQGLARFSLAGSAENGFLHRLNYLSTVSGGGYTGSWLMGWARRSSFSKAVEGLGSAGKTAGDPEPDPIGYLRDYTSFLAPRYGFTVDTATLATIVVRNLFLNWLIFLPCLMVLILLPHLLAMTSNSIAAWIINLPPYAEYSLMWAAMILIAVAGWIAAYRDWQAPRTLHGGSSIFRSETLFFWVTIIASWLILESRLAGWMDDPLGSGVRGYGHVSGIRVLGLIAGFTLASIPMSVSRLYAARRSPIDPFRVGHRLLWGRVLWSFCAPVVASAGLALTVDLFAVHVIPLLSGDGSLSNYPHPSFNVLALPVILFLLMFGSALLSGLVSIVESEEEREWWARAGGVLSIFLLAWVCAEVVGWYSELITITLGNSVLLWGGGTAIFGGGAAAVGTSAATAAGLKKIDESQLSGAGRFLARHQIIAPVLSFAALICIFLLVGTLDQVTLSFLSSLGIVANLYNFYSQHLNPGDIHFFTSAYDVAVPILAMLAILVAALANACINVNTFSLHGMYRMRLVRAFLGASNFSRDADRFTNFDSSDNFPQTDLQAVSDAPVHVLNTALNLVDGGKQAWQQRKAESFTFTPYQCGSWRLGYAPTGIYGGLHGVTLGTAMAISGAAFNPNMGYNSSPLVTLLMTLFNARLGWWLPNPRWALNKDLSQSSEQLYLGRSGPTFALASVVAEALGKTDDRRKWIQLSDGGHFENLGLYEMVLRRCHCIVLVDAGADRLFQFEDLGNAIRKINIDLGIPITFENLEVGRSPLPTESPERYCTIGKIEYCCVDSDDAPSGYLIYIKPRLLGDEPRDVSAYAATHEAFPHESTANQFFKEAQFESYRHLGSYVMGEILKSSRPNGVEELLTAALNYCGQQRFDSKEWSHPYA
jgi:hypothetical protein